MAKAKKGGAPEPTALDEIDALMAKMETGVADLRSIIADAKRRGLDSAYVKFSTVRNWWGMPLIKWMGGVGVSIRAAADAREAGLQDPALANKLEYQRKKAAKG